MHSLSSSPCRELSPLFYGITVDMDFHFGESVLLFSFHQLATRSGAPAKTLAVQSDEVAVAN